ncbi:MAG TPA: CpsD/CapB family tyrosine-protein kinase, partial [Humisphaera sp.]
LHVGAADRRARTVLVASAAPGDGRSSTAANLAVALAGSGRRVLLIDADLRGPALHAVFGVSAGAGLSDLLSTGADALADAARPTGVQGLSLLPCGPAPADPTALLNDDALPTLLDAAADAYDAVVVDAAPLSAGPDARIIAAHCDATLLVVRASASTRRGCVRACRSLLDVGARVAGVVMNAVPGGGGTRTGRPDRGWRGAEETAVRGLLTDASVPLAHPNEGDDSAQRWSSGSTSDRSW